MDWNQLLSDKRVGDYKSKTQVRTDMRTEFEKDYHRIIGSASFRRLQDKTQVFPLDKSDFIRTRLTHSLEVSSFARSLGQSVSEYILANHTDASFTQKTKNDICEILQCAGLIHDIGNPPFGHFGEEAIRNYFVKQLPKLTFKGKPLGEVLNEQMKNDFYHFEGNAQALRLVTKLHFLVNENGMNLTYALLDTIIKYPVSSVHINTSSGNIKDKKMGFFYADREIFDKISAVCGNIDKRHPLTYLLEAADDIAYRTADIEDAFKKGFISYDILLRELTQNLIPEEDGAEAYPVSLLKRQYQKAMESNESAPKLFAVQNWMVRMQSYLLSGATSGFLEHYDEILAGNYPYDIFHGTKVAGLVKLLGDIAYKYVFTSIPIMKLEVAANKIITYYLESFVPAFISYDSGVKLDIMEEKMVHLISDNYKRAYHFHASGKSEEEKLYLRLLLITDYISGMTDSFAKNLYQELNGIV